MWSRVRLALASFAAFAVVPFATGLPAHAAKITGMTPGMVYAAPGHGELLLEVFNPTTKAIVVRFQVLSPVGTWGSTDSSAEVAPGARGGISFYCDDAVYCGGLPVISPATVVPSLRWQPLTGGFDFIAAGGFRTMK